MVSGFAGHAPGPHARGFGGKAARFFGNRERAPAEILLARDGRDQLRQLGAGLRLLCLRIVLLSWRIWLSGRNRLGLWPFRAARAAGQGRHDGFAGKRVLPDLGLSRRG